MIAAEANVVPLSEDLIGRLNDKRQIRRRATMKVYVLEDVDLMEHGEEDVKFIGVYSSRQNALAAVARLSLAPGFSQAADGFHIDEYQVDQDQWVEGYTADCEKEESALG